ncbi:hypothetical protein [Cetobacterium sp.]|uniref:hypothetical protein n=1 Tax=Cetobacterium sp. TaxID=2071632 RepID=UPI003F664A98
MQGALGGLAGGNKDAWGMIGNLGAGSMWQGSQAQSGALSGLGSLLAPGGALTAEGIYNTAQGLVNHDLINSQTAALKDAVSEGLAGTVQGINQRAVAGGGMGSSRAGVAEGVATEGAAKAIAQGSAAITGAATDKAVQAAIQSGMNQLSGLGQLGSQGNNMYGQGQAGIMGGVAGNRQDLLDKLGAGGMWQSEEEKKAAIDRYNEMIKQNPSLAALGELGPLILQFAGLGGTSNTTGSSTTNSSGSSSSVNVGFGGSKK